MSLALESPAIHTYAGEHSTINFLSHPYYGLKVTIDTEHLHIESIEGSEEEYACYIDLFKDSQVMEHFGLEIPKTEEITRDKVQRWAKRWFNHNPYSGLSIYEKNTKAFVGHVILGGSDSPGISEFAIAQNKEFWGQGYATEVARAILQEYAVATVKEGYLLIGQPLEMIIATVKPCNIASKKVLEKAGMEFMYEKEKYGVLRHYYALTLNKVSNFIKLLARKNDQLRPAEIEKDQELAS